MSIRSYLEAVEWVLQGEREMHREIIVFRPGARRGYEETERDIVLPHMDAAVFSVALGAVMTGMHAVLDLREEDRVARLLNEAFAALPENACPAITMLIDAKEAAKIALMKNVQRLYPKDACQAAGLMRMALRAEYMTMFVMDEAYSDMKADVPDDDDFMLNPDGTPIDEEEEVWDDWEDVTHEFLDDVIVPQSEGIENRQTVGCEEAAEEVKDTEETAKEEKRAMSEMQHQQHIPVPAEMCSTRMLKYDPVRLEEMAKEIDASVQVLIEKCVMHIYERFKVFECCYENDALSGECAFLPPEQADALLWIGCDMLSISYYAARMDHDQAARLLREMKRFLDKPALLIYDREGREA